MNEIRNEYFPYNDLKRGEKLNEIKDRLKKFAEDFGCVVSVEYNALHDAHWARVRIDNQYFYSISVDPGVNVENHVNAIIINALRKIRRNTSVTTGKLEIKKVIFNNPCTIVLWADGDKTVVKCQDGEPFDPEKGLAMAIAKRTFGNSGGYYEEFKKWLPVDIKEFNEQVSDIIKEDAAKTAKRCQNCKHYNEPACGDRCRLCGYYTNWEPAE